MSGTGSVHGTAAQEAAAMLLLHHVASPPPVSPAELMGTGCGCENGQARDNDKCDGFHNILLKFLFFTS
jgi:hypothetical protein